MEGTREMMFLQRGYPYQCRNWKTSWNEVKTMGKSPTQLQRGYPCQCRVERRNDATTKGLPLNSVVSKGRETSEIEVKTVDQRSHTNAKGLPLSMQKWKEEWNSSKGVTPKQCKSWGREDGGQNAPHTYKGVTPKQCRVEKRNEASYEGLNPTVQ